MIDYLRIVNLALIENLEIEFSPGLNVLTGESGAGKSFILRALDFLLGDRLSPESVRSGSRQASVEAICRVDGQEMVVKRIFSLETGRSRLLINDSPSSIKAIENLRSSILTHISQHSQQKLLSPAWQARTIDSFLDDPTLPAQLSSSLRETRSKLAAIENLQAEIALLNDKKELFEYQQSVIDKVEPEQGEEEELLAKRAKLRAGSSSGQAAEAALNLLNTPEQGLLETLSNLKKETAALAEHDSDFREHCEHIEESLINMQDLNSSLRSLPPPTDIQHQLDQVEARLWELTALQRKLGRSIERILDLKEEIKQTLSRIDQAGLDLSRLNKQCGQATELTRIKCEELNTARQKAATEICKQLKTQLQGLGFSEQLEVTVDFKPTEILPSIIEQRPFFLWTPNPGQAAQPLSVIASGGELSRFLLALISLITNQDDSTLLFDELDSGIGGVTLNQVAGRIRTLADLRQVILITHWPQLASLADRHFMVQKQVQSGSTYSSCRTLEEKEILDELTRMGGGGDGAAQLAEKLVCTD